MLQYGHLLQSHFWCCSGLPPASSLFTDSETSSEAEEDRAAFCSPARSRSSVLSNKSGQAAGVSANKGALQQHDGTDLRQLQLMAAPSSGNQVCLDCWRAYIKCAGLLSMLCSASSHRASNGVATVLKEIGASKHHKSAYPRLAAAQVESWL